MRLYVVCTCFIYSAIFLAHNENKNTLEQAMRAQRGVKVYP